MMCHRSPLTVQGRSPLLLLLLLFFFFIVLSSLSLFTHTLSLSVYFTPLSLSLFPRLLFPPPHIFYLSSPPSPSLSLSLCPSPSLARCLPRLSSFISPSPFISLSHSFTDHHLCLSLPPLFFQSICSLPPSLSLHLSLLTYTIFYLHLSSSLHPSFLYLFFLSLCCLRSLQSIFSLA